MESLKTINYKGINIDIYQTSDQDPLDSRGWDTLGTMVCFHRNYCLGDKHEFDNSQELIDYLKESNAIYLPLYLLDHSGLTMNTTGFSYCDPGNWDSGQVGIIYVDRKTIRKEYNVKRISRKLIDKVICVLKSEVEVYNQYITGDVYYYYINKTNDSCGGFYGSDWENNGLLELAKETIDCYIEDRKKEHAKQLSLLFK